MGETGLEERQRRDEEKAADNKARQSRLGDIPASEEEVEDKPKPKSRAKSKTSE